MYFVTEPVKYMYHVNILNDFRNIKIELEMYFQLI